MVFNNPEKTIFVLHLERPSRPIHLNVTVVHMVEFDPGMGGKGVLVCCRISLRKWSIGEVVGEAGPVVRLSCRVRQSERQRFDERRSVFVRELSCSRTHNLDLRLSKANNFLPLLTCQQVKVVRICRSGTVRDKL